MGLSIHSLLLSTLLLLLFHGVHGNSQPTKCGTDKISKRIIGGQNAQEGDWPWHVSLRIFPGPLHICGGSLIHPNWVLTAAHCFESSKKPSSYQVSVGELILYLNSATDSFASVIRIIIHPSYKKEKSKNNFKGDIALVKLDLPYWNTPVCLPEPKTKFITGTLCWVIGWGKTNTGEFPWILQEVQVPLIDAKTCDAKYHINNPAASGEVVVLDEMICAGFEQGQKDSCQGDSGGLLVCKHQNTWFQVGVVSWGEGCAIPNRPGVYTRVQAYTDWIKKTMNFAPDVLCGPTYPTILLTLVLLSVQ